MCLNFCCKNKLLLFLTNSAGLFSLVAVCCCLKITTCHKFVFFNFMFRLPACHRPVCGFKEAFCLAVFNCLANNSKMNK